MKGVRWLPWGAFPFLVAGNPGYPPADPVFTLAGP